MIKMKDLETLRPIISLKRLLDLAGLNYNNIMSKKQRNTELKVDESEKIENALSKYGLTYDRKAVSESLLWTELF